MKTCKQGYYYCYTDKKCKKIPLGYHIGSRGYLAKDDENDGEENKNGNGTSNGNGTNGDGGGVSESKSGDSSLRDWFSKSRSSDGKPGWVQLGGKYAGKPCARQPGQTTKPKCGSSKMKRNLDKDEEQAAFRRKQRQDPNPDRKGKAINVKTEEKMEESKQSFTKKEIEKKLPSGYKLDSDEKKGKGDHVSHSVVDKKGREIATQYGKVGGGRRGKDKYSPSAKARATKIGNEIKRVHKAIDDVQKEAAGEKDACYKKVKSRYSVWPSAYASGALVKCRKVGAANWGNKTKKESYELSNWRDDFKATEYEFVDIIKAEPIKGGQDHIEEGQKCWKGYEKKGTKKMFGKTYNNCVKKEENEIDEMISTSGVRMPNQKEVEARQARKKSEKKKLPRGYVKFYDKHGKGRIVDGKKVYEDFEKEVPSGDVKKLAKKAVKRIDTNVSGHVDKKDKTMGNYGEFVPSPDGKGKVVTSINREEFSNWKQELDEKLNLKKADMGDVVKDFYKSDAPQFKGKSKEKRREMAIAAKLSADESFEIDPKAHRQAQKQQKIRNMTQSPNKNEAKVAKKKAKGPKMFGEDWQKVNKSDKTDGMSAAAVKAYRRENPGSKLKTAVTGDPKPGSKDAKRRKSFCARSKGQQDMHNIDCSKTPDKPVCKARRRWKC